jgi:ferrochelatase
VGIDLDIRDYTITGSNANYTWTEYSDLDLHLIIPGVPTEEQRELFNAKKALWAEQHTITIKGLPALGVKNLHVICPGFSADCLETIEEIDVENRGYFMEAGGESFHYIPALNWRDDHLDALADVVLSNAQDWVNVSEDTQEALAERQAIRARAQAMGCPF